MNNDQQFRDALYDLRGDLNQAAGHISNEEAFHALRRFEEKAANATLHCSSQAGYSEDLFAIGPVKKIR